MTDLKSVLRVPRKLHLWSTRDDYRQKWSDEAGLTLAEAYKLHPWPGGPPPDVPLSGGYRPKPIPVTTKDGIQESKIDCKHRSNEPIHHEPCTCKGAEKVAIHSCDLHKRCVPLQVRLNRIKDRDVRRNLKACDQCVDYCKPEHKTEDREVGDAVFPEAH